MIKVVLVDDHDLVRCGFRMIVDDAPDMEVVGEADSAEAGLRLIREQAPDVALVDVRMGGMSGLELTERVTRAGMATRIVVLTVLADVHFPKRMLEAGATGYVTKGCSADDLVTAVRRAAAGQRFLPADVAERVALSAVDGEVSPVAALTSRELEVAMMLVHGHRLTAIGEQLSVSPKTVSTYKQRLMDKLGIHHVLELARVLRTHGVIDDRGDALLAELR